MADLIIFLLLLGLGYGAGSWAEKRHYQLIGKREKQFLNLPALTAKKLVMDEQLVERAILVSGSAVISIDYFKRLLAGLRNIFGGTVKSYESLIDRARREAILRMKENAHGASMIVNVRIETSTIGKNAVKGKVGSVEALAYGTAITMKP
ncbi:MAG: heavy metal-binding domain-containing protein [Deltaproteobacteria bacterium]|nr:heavy metal-binding domain-containing protein [Candidatus Anaeroferrophillus wilburensis]MBN2887958.1 heavy metal-binding domain-containing protein [Deltaproteobacteria bacterium]